MRGRGSKQQRAVVPGAVPGRVAHLRSALIKRSASRGNLCPSLCACVCVCVHLTRGTFGLGKKKTLQELNVHGQLAIAACRKPTCMCRGGGGGGREEGVCKLKKRGELLPRERVLLCVCVCYCCAQVSCQCLLYYRGGWLPGSAGPSACFFIVLPGGNTRVNITHALPDKDTYVILFRRMATAAARS